MKVVNYFHDSVKVVVDDNGKAVTRTEYLPYGETWFQEGDDKNAPKYNSQELDKETNFYFYNARHYDPEISRFVTADNVIDGEGDSQGWNRFSYVKGNPIRYKDPTGHQIKTGKEQREKNKAKRRAEFNKSMKRIDKSGGPVKLKGEEALRARIQLGTGRLKMDKEKMKLERNVAGLSLLNKANKFRAKITAAAAGVIIAAHVLSAAAPVITTAATALTVKSQVAISTSSGALSKVDTAVKFVKRITKKIDPWKDTKTTTKDVSGEMLKIKQSEENLKRIKSMDSVNNVLDIIVKTAEEIIKKKK